MYSERMAKTKQSTDVNVTAFEILQAVTGEPASKPKKPTPSKKNPAAVALGRLGGRKGGKARAEKLSAAKRREIVSRAAKARWSKG